MLQQDRLVGHVVSETDISKQSYRPQYRLRSAALFNLMIQVVSIGYVLHRAKALDHILASNKNVSSMKIALGLELFSDGPSRL